MSTRVENKLVADGQALANRIVTLRSQSVVPAYAFRKTVLSTTIRPDEERDLVTWSGLGQLSDSDEHAYDYEPIGHAMVLLLDVLGGNMHDTDTMIMPEQMSATALVEPYDINLEGEERIRYRPEWTLKKGDLLCLLFTDEYKEYYECTGRIGHSMLADHGGKYILNQRLDLDYLDVFDEEKLEDIQPYQ